MAKNTDQLAIVYDDVIIDPGALASKDCAVGASKIDAARSQGFRTMKTEYWITYEGKTDAQGPLMVGFSPTKSASTIEEAIEADPQIEADRVTNMQAKEPVFPLEMIPAAGTGNTDGFGAKGVFKPRWSTPEEVAAFWWVYNMDAAALDTGLKIHVFAKHYGVWLRD